MSYPTDGIAILHSPQGCAHCHPQGALLSAAEDAQFSDFYDAAPDWAKSAIEAAHKVFYAMELRKLSDKEAAHIAAAIACVKSINHKCERQVNTFGSGKTSSVKRHKRTRAQIRMAKASAPKEQPKAKDKKKGGK